jgi:polyisoprenoid-binding protein YceI
MTGVLSLHGVQKELTWELKLRRESNVITGLATVNVLFSDFGVSPPNIAGFVSVQDDVTLQMQIVAQQG